MQRTGYGKGNKEKSETSDGQTTSGISVLMPEDDTNPLDLQRMYGPLSDFALKALQLDMLLNPIVSQINNLKRQEVEAEKGKKSGKAPTQIPALKSALLKERKAAILELLEVLTKLCKSGSLSYLDFLQAQRLIDTFEYSLLSGDPGIDKARAGLDSAIAKLAKVSYLSEESQLKLMHDAISGLWPINFEAFCKLLT